MVLIMWSLWVVFPWHISLFFRSFFFQFFCAVLLFFNFVLLVYVVSLLIVLIKLENITWLVDHTPVVHFCVQTLVLGQSSRVGGWFAWWGVCSGGCISTQLVDGRGRHDRSVYKTSSTNYGWKATRRKEKTDRWWCVACYNNGFYCDTGNVN